MFFLVWRGKGLILILGALLLSMLIYSFLGILSHNEGNLGLYFFALIPGFIPLWFYGNKINQLVETGYVDKNTGEDIYTQNIHTFFWIPIQYFGIIVPVFAIIGILSTTN